MTSTKTQPDKSESSSRHLEVSLFVGVICTFAALFFQFLIATRWIDKNAKNLPSAEAQIALLERRTPFFMPEIILRTFTGGLLPLYLDWSWIRVLTDDTLLRLPRSERTRLYHTLMHVTEIDPAYFEAYVVGGGLLAVIRDDVYGARDLLLRGESFRIEKLPAQPKEVRLGAWKNAWQIPYQLGYVYLIELEDIPSAAIYLNRAADLPGSPEFLKRLGEKLDSQKGRYTVARNILRSMLSAEKNRNQDSRLVQELSGKLTQIDLSEFFWDANDLLNQTLQASSFEARRNRFYDLLRQGRISPVDPQGAPIEFLKTPTAPNGAITSSSPRSKVLGIQ
jgi:hypothetical protein